MNLYPGPCMPFFFLYKEKGIELEKRKKNYGRRYG